MASANVKSGNLSLIASDDDSDDEGTATGGKPGVKHVDTKKVCIMISVRNLVSLVRTL